MESTTPRTTSAFRNTLGLPSPSQIRTSPERRTASPRPNRRHFVASSRRPGAGTIAGIGLIRQVSGPGSRLPEGPSAFTCAFYAFENDPAVAASFVPLMTARYAPPSACPARVPPWLSRNATGERPPPGRTVGCNDAIRIGSSPRTEPRGDSSPRSSGSGWSSLFEAAS